MKVMIRSQSIIYSKKPSIYQTQNGHSGNVIIREC